MRATRVELGLIVAVANETETDRLARALAPLVTPNTVVGLIGPLGAGKTRFVRALAEALGADPDDVSSPTFVLVHEYEGRLPIFHFDTYRLTSVDAFESLGAAEYAEAGGVCLIEWADKVADALPASRWTIRIDAPDASSDERIFHLALGRDAADALARDLAAGPLTAPTPTGPRTARRD